MNATTLPTTSQATPAPAASTEDRYHAPGWFTRNLMNRLIRRLARLGVSFMGSTELHIVGRASGEVRTTVVNVLELDGERYLVAPRGQAAWVKNLRAAGGGERRVGRRTTAFTATELADDAAKVAVLRAYLVQWAWEVGQFFPGTTKDSTDAEVLAIAPGFPAFRLTDHAA